MRYRILAPALAIALAVSAAAAARADGAALYSVQVRAVPVAEREDGLNTYRALKDQGLLAYHYEARIGDARWLRVAFGAYPSKEAAEAAGRAHAAQTGAEFFVAPAPLRVIEMAGGDAFIVAPSALWQRGRDAVRELLAFGRDRHGDPFRPGRVEFVPSPDRSAIAFAYGNRLAIARIGAAEVRFSGPMLQMGGDGGDLKPTPQWSPSGRYLALIDFRDFEVNSSLWLIDAKYGFAHPLVYNWGPGSEEAVKDFVWHPTDNIVLFIEGYAFGSVSVGGGLRMVDTASTVRDVLARPRAARWELTGPLRIAGGRLHYRKAEFDDNFINITYTDASIPLPAFDKE